MKLLKRLKESQETFLQSGCKNFYLTLQANIKEQMRRAVHITIMSLATLLVLAVGVMPHHHHGTAECPAMERCAVDNVVNDEHTAHHVDDIAGNCCFVTHILLHRCTSFSHHIVNKCPLMAVSVAAAFVVDAEVSEDMADEGYVLPYTSPDVYGNRLLRAPPRKNV